MLWLRHSHATCRRQFCARPPRRSFPRSRPSTAEMGWWEALADSASRRLLAARYVQTAGRAVLRRPRCAARSDAATRAAQRHQPSRHQLLLVVEEGPRHHVADDKVREPILRVSKSIQPAIG